MQQMYVGAIDMAHKIGKHDSRFIGYLEDALRKMEIGVEMNVTPIFRDGFSDIAAAAMIVEYNVLRGKVEA